VNPVWEKGEEFVKELKNLLDYIDYYVYSFEDEEVIIKNGPDAEKALEEYNKGLVSMGLENFSYDINNNKYARLFKWVYDVAIDCVRNMSFDDKLYISTHLDTSIHHLDYALEIRNTYIHRSKKHKRFYADGVSTCVMKMIFSIISTEYNN